MISGLSLRTKAIVLFTAMTLGPVIAAIALLIDVNSSPVRATEQMIQSAVVAEIAGASQRTIRDVTSDAVSAAAIFARAVSGGLRDEEAIEAVRGLIATRGLIDAVRFEVPEAHISTVIRKAGSAGDVPEGTEPLRRKADDRGVGFGVIGPGRGLVVARVRASEAAPAGAGSAPPPKGYVVAAVDLGVLAEDLREIAGRRFGGKDVALLIVTQDRATVASFGVPSAQPGSDASNLPIWSAISRQATWNAPFSVVTPHMEGGRQMVGTIESVPELGWAVAIWRPEPVAYAALADMRRRGIAVAVVAALLALAVGLAAARGLTRPILDLVAQARLIGQRRWRDVALGTAGAGAAYRAGSAGAGAARRDEIGELTASLGRMAADLEQGEAEIAREAKLRTDLGRFMDKAVVEAIVRGEHPLALGGKRATVSVVFADVVGFTPLAEARDAERVVALLNELFSMLTEIVFRHGGTVDKFIGDCIMAVWGAPVPADDHAHRALAAAEDMMRFLETANEDWKEKYDVEIRLGIGVNSGEAIVGNIGSDKRMEYTVIGDVVNVAARLEAIAAPNQVLVSDETRRLVGDAFPLDFLGEQNLTGRKTATLVYALSQD